MVRLTFVAVLLSTFGFVSSVQAMDNKLKAALYEIERAEQQISSAQPNQAAKLKRIGGMIESASTQLSASANQSDPAWIEAKNRLDALNDRMMTLKAPKAPDPNLANQLSPQDLGLLGSIDRRTDGLIREVNEYETPDFARLQQKLQNAVANLKQQYQGLTNPSHPQAIAVAQKVLAVEKRINDEISKHNSGQSQVADASARLNEITERLNPSNRPWFGSPVPDKPFTKQKVDEYTTYVTGWKEAAQKDQAFLQQLSANTTDSNVTSLLHRVTGELQSIDQYNATMSKRMLDELSGVDQIDTYVDKVPLSRMDSEIQRLEYAINLVDLSQQFDSAVGRQPAAMNNRQDRYQGAIAKLQKRRVTLEAEAKAAAAKRASQPATPKKSIFGSLTAQNIEVYGARKIQVTKDGEIWIDGNKTGDITLDGEIWVEGDKEGDITADGEVWKAGNKVGDITTDGEVWRNGNKIGNIEADKTIWINGTREGWYEGGNPVIAGAILFYGFFDL